VTRALAVLVCLMTFAPVPVQGQELFPATIRVRDSVNNEPIKSFEYQYRVSLNEGGVIGGYKKWIKVDGDDGAFVIDLPRSCELDLRVRATHYVYDYPTVQSYPIRADDDNRVVVVNLVRGVTVTGRIVSDDDDRPIADALISPTIFTPPGLSPDRERAVRSGPDGSFEIHGVSTRLGITLEHRDYLLRRHGLGVAWDEEPVPDAEYDFTVRMDPGETLFGRVIDDSGDPVEGATVDDGTGKSAVTDAKGRFTIKGSRRRVGYGNLAKFGINVRKSGFVRYNDPVSVVPEDGVEITLVGLLRVEGRVTNEAGRPVQQFTVYGGRGPNPAPWRSVKRAVNDPEGRFTIEFEFEDDRNWIAVAAEGYALAETWTPFKRAGAQVDFTLNTGSTVQGQVAGAPDSIVNGVAKLIYKRLSNERYSSNEGFIGQLSSQEAPIDASGRFSFANVRPDHYTLHVDADNFTGRHLLVGVTGGELVLEPIGVRGVGSISGRIFERSGQPWAFAEGYISHASLGEDNTWDRKRTFRADEDGRFTVPDVPAGDVYVGFSFMVSADMGSSYGETVRVVPGETASVVVNDPGVNDAQDVSTPVEVAVQIIIGDGSDEQRRSGTAMGGSRKVGYVSDDTPRVTGRPPRFGVTFNPLAHASGASPASHSGTLNSGGRLRVPQVRPGEYEILVEDQPLPMRFYTGEAIARKKVTVRGPDFTVFEISLGAGSITGQGRLPDNDDWREEAFAIGYAFAIGQTGGLVRTAAADERGNFCLRYLPPDRYRSRFWHAVLGWAEFDVLEVDAVSLDVGEQSLIRGATLNGQIELVGASSVPTEVRLRDEDGIAFSPVQFRHGYETRFSVTNLWPSRWTVLLMSNEKEIARAVVEIKDASPVQVTLGID